jgi:hypothetical protein
MEEKKDEKSYQFGAGVDHGSHDIYLHDFLQRHISGKIR